MPDILSPSRNQIVLNAHSEYTEEQNIALSKTKNTKTPEQLAEENMPFVYHLIDKEFSRYYKVVGIPREILVSAGITGLVVAANKSKYGTFIRYASFWIRYYIYAEIRGYFFIKRQSSYCLKLNKIRKFQARYKNKHDNEEPTMEQLAKMTGYTVDVVIDTIKFDEENSTSSISYEGMMEDPDDKTKLDAVIESQCDSINIDRIEYKNLQKLICHVLSGNQRDGVLLRYFGHLTNRQISERLNRKVTSNSISSMVEKGIELIKLHIEKEKRFNELTGMEGRFCPVNYECDKRNVGFNFDEHIKNLLFDCSELTNFEE